MLKILKSKPFSCIENYVKNNLMKIIRAVCKFRFHIIWNIRKIQVLFNNKDRLQHLRCVIYKGVCCCSADLLEKQYEMLK